MAEKKKSEPDSRDIFEKALDVALPVATMAGGAMLGGKAARALSGLRNPKVIEREMRALRPWDPSKSPAERKKALQKYKELESEFVNKGYGPSYALGGLIGARQGAEAGGLYLDSVNPARRKRRK